MGTKDITLLDIWYGSFWEFIYMADCQMTTKKVVIFPHRGQYPKDIQIGKKAPAWKAYVERFREHPAIKPYRMKQEVWNAQTEFSQKYEDREETSKLSLEAMKGCYDEF